jgi:hypothetical protein
MHRIERPGMIGNLRRLEERSSAVSDGSWITELAGYLSSGVGIYRRGLLGCIYGSDRLVTGDKNS